MSKQRDNKTTQQNNDHNSQKPEQKSINWTNTLFLTITPIVGAIAAALLAVFHLISTETIIFTILLMGATGVSITAGYHRLFAHGSYKAAWPVRLFFALFGAACFEGSIIDWATDHRVHHLHSDTDRDPYSIKKGFFHAHMGWLIFLDTSKRDYSNVQDLMEDPIVSFQHKYFVPLGILMGFFFPMAIATIWGDPIGGFFIAGALRISLNQHLTFCINSLAHLIGDRPYSNSTARDNWIVAILTYGEGYHNYHHQFAKDYRNGIKFYHYDPSKWVIFMLNKVGLASDLITIEQPRIVRYSMRAAEQSLKNRLAKAEQQVATRIQAIIDPARDAVNQALGKLENVEKAYKQFKKEHLHIAEYKNKIAEYQAHVKQAQRELKRTLSNWSNTIRHGEMLAYQ